MPTIIGVVFFCFGMYCFFYAEDCLLGLLLIASIFQAASAINIAERGIQPYYVVAMFIIVRALANRMLGIRYRRTMPQGNWLLIFGVISIASAFVLPVIFAGIPVYDPKIGIDDGLFIHPALHFGLNNVGQAGFLAWHIATAYATLSIRFSSAKTRRAYLWSFYLASLFVSVQALCQFAGVSFPDTLIRNNPGYSLSDAAMLESGTRNPGTFTEPSVAGAFILIYGIGFIAQFLVGKRNILKVVVSLIVSGLIASSGSIFSLCAFTFALLLRYSPFRFPWHIKIRQTKQHLLLASIVIIPLAVILLVSSTYRDTLFSLTVSKGESGSFINRTASDLYALGLLSQTYGLGVGLGSSRASSLVTTLLSNIGVLGFLFFGLFYFRLFTGFAQENVWLKWSAFALLLNMSFGIADITIPIIWVPILLAIQIKANDKDSQLKGSNRPSETTAIPSRLQFCTNRDHNL